MLSYELRTVTCLGENAITKPVLLVLNMDHGASVLGDPLSAMKVPWPLILLATHMRYDQLLGISFI